MHLPTLGFYQSYFGQGHITYNFMPGTVLGINIHLISRIKSPYSGKWNRQSQDIKNRAVYSAHCIPSTVLSTLHILTPIMLITTLRGKYCYSQMRKQKQRFSNLPKMTQEINGEIRIQIQTLLLHIQPLNPCLSRNL